MENGGYLPISPEYKLDIPTMLLAHCVQVYFACNTLRNTNTCTAIMTHIIVLLLEVFTQKGPSLYKMLTP